MPYFNKNRASLYYETYPSHLSKESDTIVLIHGNGLNSSCWDLIIPYLQPYVQIVMYDLRGHGLSEDGEGVVTWELLIDDLQSILRHLQIERYHLVGHGLGANIAVKFALHEPDNVISTILLSAPFVFPPSAVDKTIHFRRSLTEEGGMTSLARHMIPAITTHSLDSGEGQKLLRSYETVSIEMYFRLLDLVIHSRPADDLKLLHTYTLVLSGERDQLYHTSLFGLTAGLIANSKFFVVPNASNMVFIDQPKLTALWIRQFIANPQKKDRQITLPSDLIVHDIRRMTSELVAFGYEKMYKETYELDVQLLQTFRISINGNEVRSGWERRSAKRLLLYMIFHRTATRDELCDKLWPAVELKKARSNLRVYLVYLKTQLNAGPSHDGFLIIDNERIQLRGTIRCDLLEFVEKLNEAYHEPEPLKKLALTASLLHSVRWPLLEGFYDAWVLKMREAIEAQVIDLIHWVVQHLIEQEKYKQAIEYAKNGLLLSADDETLYDQLIYLCELSNQSREALHWKKRKTELLENEE